MTHDHDPAYPKFIPALGLKLECVPGCPECAATDTPVNEAGPDVPPLF